MYGPDNTAPRNTVSDILDMKQRGEKIVMLTAYDYPSARLAEEGGVDMILVGDSLGMVVLGYDSTLPVTLDDMLHHTKAVVRGAKKPIVVTDLPFMTYQASVEDAMRNAGRLLQEGGALSQPCALRLRAWPPGRRLPAGDGRHCASRLRPTPGRS